MFVHGSARNPLNEYVFPEDIYNQRKMEKIFSLVELSSYTVAQARAFFEQLVLQGSSAQIALEVLKVPEGEIMREKELPNLS